MNQSKLFAVLIFIVSLIITIALIYLLNSRIGSTPPIGKLLDPFQGIWQTALIPDIPVEESLDIPGLQQEVTVVYNDRGVPHIFALNDQDLYLAQGYITARHRLWQMEFSTHAAAGRISEIVGKQAINFDKYHRKIGMTYGAEASFNEISKDEWTLSAVQAYSDGVNAFIDQLDAKNLPFEYKLLDYKPESWAPIKTAIFFMNMNKTLSFRSSTYANTRLKHVFGKEMAEALFPNTPEINEPIISKDRIWDFNPGIPSIPENDFTPDIVTNEFNIPEGNPGIGSNNWAIHGSKTASKAPILASDPHLSLTLPSIWYEVQLHAPGINTYGVSLPGVPGVIIGFNENISWAVTNTGGFAMDIFEVKLSDDKNSYFHDGQWKSTQKRVETYSIRGEESIVDTVYYTHHGPIAYLNDEFAGSPDSIRINPFDTNMPTGHAVQWIAHQASNPMLAFYHLNRGQNFTDFEKGVTYLESPAQNFAFASVDGDIAMKISGKHPVRFSGQGKYISDGTDPTYDWVSYIPHNEVPWQRNPERGFVSSANQDPADESYPYFLGQDFASPARATIINRTLDGLTQATPQDMIALQINEDNYWADEWLDIMLDSLATKLDTMSDLEIQVIERLKSWDRKNSAESIEARIFIGWLNIIKIDLFGDINDELGPPVPRISNLTTLYTLFHLSDLNVYEKLKGTNPNTSEILIMSFSKVIANLQSQYGDEINENWQHWVNNGSTIRHILDTPALNQDRLKIGGSSESPNAIRNNNGPSWRMVVEMSTPIKAWGVYPGGQSGNPASSNYNSFIPNWATGNHFELKLYQNTEEAINSTNRKLILK